MKMAVGMSGWVGFDTAHCAKGLGQVKPLGLKGLWYDLRIFGSYLYMLVYQNIIMDCIPFNYAKKRQFRLCRGQSNPFDMFMFIY